MKILFLHRFRNFGGAEHQLIELANGLARRGHKIVVLTFYDSPKLHDLLEPSGVRVVSLDKTGRWDMVGFGLRLVRTLFREHPDLTHGYLGFANALLVLTRLLHRGKVVWGVRSSDIDISRYDRLAKFDAGIEKALCRFPNLIIANSQTGRDFAIARGFPARKLIVIPNGIDLDRFQRDEPGRRRLRAEWGIADDSPVIGRVGRIDPQKDYETFLRAAAIVAPQRPDIRFVIVGSDPHNTKADLQSFAKSLGLGSELIWNNHRDDMPSVYSAMDICASTSAYGEGIPNVLVEAMACGTACITTDVGDAELTIDGLGPVVPKSNPEAMAAAMIKAVDMQPDRAKLREYVASTFSMDRLVTTSERVLEGVARGVKPDRLLGGRQVISINLWGAYRKFLIVFAVSIFFTNFSDYSQRWGMIPLYWVVLFALLAGPAIFHGAMSGRFPIPPLLLWGTFYLGVSLLWFYRTDQDAFAFQEVKTRILSVLYLMLILIVVSRPQDQRLARQAIAWAVVLATALNLYELVHPLTFSTIPGRSTGLYTNVNQSGAALVLGLILSYQIVPDRLKMLFVLLTAAGVIPTFSRSAMIGWVIVVGYFYMRAGLVAQIRRVLAFSVIGVTLIFSPIWKDVQAYLEKRGVLNLDVLGRINFFTNGNVSDASANERKAVAARAWQLFGDHPLIGWGTGASRRIEGFDVGTHNIYLAMLVDHGAIGFFIVPTLLLAVIWGANRKTMDQTIPFVLFMVIWGLFSHNMLEERYILLATGLMAAMVASNRRVTVEAVEPASDLARIPPTALLV